MPLHPEGNGGVRRVAQSVPFAGIGLGSVMRTVSQRNRAAADSRNSAMTQRVTTSSMSTTSRREPSPKTGTRTSPPGSSGLSVTPAGIRSKPPPRSRRSARSSTARWSFFESTSQSLGRGGARTRNITILGDVFYHRATFRTGLPARPARPKFIHTEIYPRRVPPDQTDNKRADRADTEYDQMGRTRSANAVVNEDIEQWGLPSPL